MQMDMYQKESGVTEPKKQMLRQGIKKAALLAAVDMSLKRMNRSPNRCARNMTELGMNAFPNRYPADEYPRIQQELLSACKAQDPLKARELFVFYFINENH